MAEGEKVGGVYIEIEAETAKLLTGQQQANRALDSISDHAQKTAGQLNKLDTQVSATAKGVSSGLRSGFQQAGYQLQDFIVQVQGGQSALVAFSQQGAQLAGVLGPGGAIVGAVIALGSVLAGILMPSLSNSADRMKELQTAAESLNKIVVINSQGVAALSNDYARLAATNAALATQLRDAAIAKYAAEVENARDVISNIVEQQSSWLRSLNGGVASVKAAGNAISTLEISATDYNEAMKQANEAGPSYNSTILTLSNTVEMLSSKFDISRQSSFELVKMLNDLSKNPTPDNVTRISQAISTMSSTSSSGSRALAEFRAELTAAGASAANAAQTVKDLENQLQSLRTEAQQANFDGISKQLETQRIALTKGKQAAIEYGISQQDLTEQQKEDLIAQSRVIASLEEKKKAQQEAERNNKKAATSNESVSQKLEQLRQKSLLAANSAQELSREMSILTAQQSLGKGATQEQLNLAGQYAAKAWDAAAAAKGVSEALKAMPEKAEGKSYADSMQSLKAALDAGKINIKEYNTATEQMEQQHQINLAKIRAGQVVTPQQQAQGEVDPVQRLANQHAQELALIQQFETQKGQLTANGIALMNAANTQYEKARIDAQWEIFRNQSTTNELMASAVDGFASQAASSMTGLIDGTQSATEAFQNLGSAIVNSVIQALVEVGVQYLKNAAMAMIADKMTSNSSQQAGAQTAAAWAPAAAAASIATFGGAAIAGIAGMVAAFAIGAALAGKRKNGGPVSAGSMYQVGEGGMPEIYRASNGSQYMIPGDNGSVISNKDLQGSGGGALQVVNNVYNYANGVNVDTRSSQNGGQLVIETFITDMQNGGPMSSQMQDTFGLRRQANGDY
ncbi:phage tail protein [Klebsiella aerogenes]|uniref:phage tail protein n=1 Tax=Klebsiella aerogenes TaxID=548 RepID=UPI0018C21BB6|nr:phage tail protein [Klebsiella aerogenes]MBF9782948.1 phage tail protein [Klebsiella aerogenes]MBF9797454.1 phage tail protein [Klebsiella aerogenes]